MDTDDEKFFEVLAEQKTTAEGEYHEGYGVELAKAKPAAVKQPTLKKEEKLPDFDGAEGQLTVDVYQNEKEIVIESAIAGVKADDLDIHVTKDSVNIKGERNREQRVENEDYFYQECYWGRFSRSIILPQEVDPDGATVNFKNGILIIRLPKSNRSASKKLRVKVE